MHDRRCREADIVDEMDERTPAIEFGEEGMRSTADPRLGKGHHRGPTDCFEGRLRRPIAPREHPLEVGLGPQRQCAHIGARSRALLCQRSCLRLGFLTWYRCFQIELGPACVRDFPIGGDLSPTVAQMQQHVTDYETRSQSLNERQTLAAWGDLRRRDLDADLWHPTSDTAERDRDLTAAGAAGLRRYAPFHAQTYSLFKLRCGPQL